jgi:hypothetical protein
MPSRGYSTKPLPVVLKHVRCASHFAAEQSVQYYYRMRRFICLSLHLGKVFERPPDTPLIWSSDSMLIRGGEGNPAAVAHVRVRFSKFSALVPVNRALVLA